MKKYLPDHSCTKDAEEPTADLLWGMHPVTEALMQHPETLSEIRIQQGKSSPRLQHVIDLARERHVTLRFTQADRMGVPQHCRHQGIVARQTEARLLQLDDFLEQVQHASSQGGRILALDSIQDPHNLGSILRSALAAGFSHVLMTRDRSVPVTGTVARIAAGALSHLHLCQVVNLVETLNILKKRGFWIYGAVAEPDTTSLYNTDFSESMCLIIGSEGKGIRPLVRTHCDFLLTIPMLKTWNSLNASVAAAVIMFEISRRLQKDT